MVFKKLLKKWCCSFFFLATYFRLMLSYRISPEISGKLTYLVLKLKDFQEIQISKRKEEVVSPESEACLVQEFLFSGKHYTSKLI